jgi:hypothetical protein
VPVVPPELLVVDVFEPDDDELLFELPQPAAATASAATAAA